MKTTIFIFLTIAFLTLWGCSNEQDEPVNLISPTGRLLAKNTREIKKLIVKFNQDITNIDSIHLKKISYREKDSVTVAQVDYSYGDKQKSTYIYLNNVDSSNKDKTLLEYSKKTVIVQPDQPVVIILNDENHHNDTLRISTKFKTADN